MPDIKHHLEIDAKPEAVFKAVATREGVASWWTPRVGGDDALGGRLRMDFRAGFGEFEVAERDPAGHLRWDCKDNNAPEWIGTTVTFDVEPRDEGATLRFGHNGWAEQSDFFASCNYFWGHFMRSLKQYVETGEGMPR